MRSIIFLILFVIPSSVIASNITEDFFSEKDKISKSDFSALGALQEKYIIKFEHLYETCGTQQEYFDLITLSHLIEGSHQLEYYSEVASEAIMYCPNELLKAMEIHHSEVVSKFVDALVIKIAPWDVAQAIYPALMKTEHKNMYETYFKNWVHNCVNSKGVAIVGCGQ